MLILEATLQKSCLKVFRITNPHTNTQAFGLTFKEKVQNPLMVHYEQILFFHSLNRLFLCD